MFACLTKRVLVILLLMPCLLFAQKKSIPVREALKKITKAFGTQFVYERQLLEGKTTAYDLDGMKSKTVEEVLKGVLYPNNLVFLYIRDNYYSIVEKDRLSDKNADGNVSSTMNNSGAQASGRLAVSGIVKDSSGGSLSGVTVTEKGTNNMTATAPDGSFSLQVSSNKSELVFSSVGYDVKQIKVGNNSRFNVSLDRSSGKLDEVVVVGYGTQRKSDLTGSLSRVNSEQLNRNKTTDLLSAMEGKLAGVMISSQSGELGSGFTIKIRGANSINGSSDPLFVIDGIPMDINPDEIAGSSLNSSVTSNPLSNLNPADIESIEILKDASATAIYGSRGANGVVLITTKSGKAGKTALDYDGNVRFGQLSKKLDVLNGQQFLDYRKQKFGDTDVLVLGMDPNQDGIIDVPSHDWQSEIYQPSFSQSHTLTMSGGSKATVFSGSVNYVRDEGIIPSNTSNRYGLRLRVDHNVNDRLKMGVNINSSDVVINGATNSGGAFTGVTRRILFSSPVDLFNPSNAEGYDTYISPVIDIDESYRNSNTTRTIGSTYLNYKLTKDLLVSVTAGGTISDSKGREFYNSSTTGGVKVNGLGVVQNIHSYNWTNTNQLTYNKRFNANNSINVIGVFELSSYSFGSDGMQAENFTDQSTGINDISKAGTITGVNTYLWKNNRASYLSRINYSFMDRYLLTASIRADGSDKFGENNKWGYFPSAALAWRISRENFMQNIRAVSNLKLRLSYGVTGNELIPPYSYLPLLENAYYGSNSASQLGLATINPGNPDLKWEQSTQTNIGLDVGLFKDRFELSIDGFEKKVNNMLIKAQLPTQTGYYYQWQNIGRIDNRGAELSIVSHTIQNKNFTWDMDVNVSYNQSQIKSLGGAQSLPITFPGEIAVLGELIVGQPFGTGYGYVGDGIYQISDFTWQNNSDPTIASADRVYTLKSGVPSFAGASVQPGSYKFKDISGPSGKPDGIINSYDQQVISHSQPKFTGGFTSTMHYKKFDFSFFLQGVSGRQILNTIKLDMTGFRAQRNFGTDFFYNRWTENNPTNKYGTFSDANATARYNSTFYVEDGSYLRLKSVMLAYNFDFKQTKKVFTKLKVYVTANDFWTLTNYSGYDPEVEYKNDLLTGVDALAYPRTKTFIVGVNASF